jgi:TatD DNase family protein
LQMGGFKWCGWTGLGDCLLSMGTRQHADRDCDADNRVGAPGDYPLIANFRERKAHGPLAVWRSACRDRRHWFKTKRRTMRPTFYDTHAHLDYPDYEKDFGEVLTRAEQAGITCMICIGTSLASSAAVLQLAEQHPNLYAAVGWHPSHCLEAPEDIRPQLREMALHPKVVALGETGLDYHRLPSKEPGKSAEDDASYKNKQADLFEQHLEVATENGLNCIVHERDAFEDTLSIMIKWAGKVRGVFHCFVGSPLARERIQGIGSLVSFTGICTFKNAPVVRESILAAPLGEFMLETDCPYLAPVPYRGKRCEPAYVKEIAETIARVKHCSLEELSEATCATAHRFFPKIS